MLSQLLRTISGLPRSTKRLVTVLFDVVILCLSLWASFSLRYDTWNPPGTVDDLVLIALAPAVSIPIFARLGLYRAVIRYLPERAMWTIVQATTLAVLFWVAAVFLLEFIGRGALPRSVPLLYWAISTVLIAGSRYLAKRVLVAGAGQSQLLRPALVYGAGEAGIHLVNAFRLAGGRQIVGFIDDNSAIQGRDVAGVRVYSPTRLEGLIERFGVTELIISIPSLSARRRQEILERVAGRGVAIRSIPAISDLIDGKLIVGQIREVDIDELLGRSAVAANTELLQDMIEGKIVLVTGAGGSIGSELCRLVSRWRPQRLVLLEANEFALYRIDKELAQLPDVSVVPILASVADQDAVARALKLHRVQVVFHAAAHKHVPLVEANAIEGMRNNILGTKVISDLAFEAGVESFVLISSDKAVRPTNVMGATKRWAELIVRDKAELARERGTGQRFCAVRFGNVLGSNGSVVPLFKEQIARGGPVTLTDVGMTRYFMSIHEAAELIVQASALSQGGDIFLLDMGEPILIRDLAENMIRLAGFTVRDEHHVNGDIEIVVTGKRPGEKMYEELFYDDDSALQTSHAKIMRAESMGTEPNLDDALSKLIAAMDQGDEPLARSILFDFITER
ncbi:polysaccharide biosynthesis protein [Devosia sediminis]|uniref:Polysaccharide biosynthesis protein n=1 Tax=Devosia sediminis TaxID=2798801 RepID=A0A934IXV7_9HYPH|nr:nucleoside-diphosphate sugar epimerase/dehydratase [Devosia sediminis]MBJ3785050.1 polysaccharide biosynthesis protein [Devosia sediminis]